MALLKYFRPAVPTKAPSLTERELQEANTGVKEPKNETSHTRKGMGSGKYNDYMPEERAASWLALQYS